MTRYLLVLLGTCGALLSGGCATPGGATTDFDADRNETRYASSKMLIGRINMSSGLASGQRVTMQAVASCEGKACMPTEYDLAFLNDSGADLNMDYRRVRMTFGGREFDWQDVGRLDEPEEYGVPRGEFIRVSLPASDVRLLASSRDVEIFFGLTSTVRLAVPYDRLEPLRELLRAVHDA